MKLHLKFSQYASTPINQGGEIALGFAAKIATPADAGCGYCASFPRGTMCEGNALDAGWLGSHEASHQLT